MNHYEVLQISERATQEVIRAAYRTLAQRFHPDRAGDTPANHERLSRINLAYEVLSDEKKRAAYDATLAGGDGAVRAPFGPVPKPPQGAPINGFPAPVVKAPKPVPGVSFAVKSKLGTVLHVESWSESHVSGQGGGGVVLGGWGMTHGTKIKTTVVDRQRIALRLAGGDEFFSVSGNHLALAPGQRVALLSVESSKFSGAIPVAVWNADSGQTVWLSGNDMGTGAAASKLSPWGRGLRNFAAGVAIFVGGCWAVWHFLGWWLILIFPFLLGLSWLPFLFSNEKINSLVQREVRETVDKIYYSGATNNYGQQTNSY